MPRKLDNQSLNRIKEADAWLRTGEGRAWAKQWKQLNPNIDLRSREDRLRRISKVLDKTDTPETKKLLDKTAEDSRILDRAIDAWCSQKKLNPQQAGLVRSAIDVELNNSFTRQAEYRASKSTGLRRAIARTKKDGLHAKFSPAELPWAGIAVGKVYTDFGWTAPAINKECQVITEAVRSGVFRASKKTLTLTRAHHGKDAGKNVGKSVSLLRAILIYAGFPLAESYVADLIRRKR